MTRAESFQGACERSDAEERWRVPSAGDVFGIQIFWPRAIKVSQQFDGHSMFSVVKDVHKGCSGLSASGLLAGTHITARDRFQAVVNR